jgi:putative oxidoreductase
MASGGVGGTSDLGLLFLRLSGAAFATHGYQKIFQGDMSKFAAEFGAKGFPVPSAFAWVTALTELLGGLLVAFGLYTRFGAAFAAVIMFVAAFLLHASEDFRTREMELLYLVVMLAVACLGPGKWSLDGVVRKTV